MPESPQEELARELNGRNYTVAMKEYKRRLVTLALAANSGSVWRAAKALGLAHHGSVISLVKYLGIETARKPPKPRRVPIITINSKHKSMRRRPIHREAAPRKHHADRGLWEKPAL